jgi:hypothetical protein
MDFVVLMLVLHWRKILLVLAIAVVLGWFQGALGQ